MVTSTDLASVAEGARVTSSRAWRASITRETWLRLINARSRDGGRQRPVLVVEPQQYLDQEAGRRKSSSSRALARAVRALLHPYEAVVRLVLDRQFCLLEPDVRHQASLPICVHAHTTLICVCTRNQ